MSLRPDPEGVVKVLVYGAGDFGEMLVADLRRQNGRSPMKPAGFLDDNARKRHQVICGVTVWGSGTEIEKVHKRTRFEQLILSSGKISEENLEHIKRFCKARGIPVKRYAWTCEDVA